jgi:hypothetical protein
MRLAQGDVGDARLAYGLFSKRTQGQLKARAQRYSAASGKPISPEAMLVPSRFALRFEPQRYTARVLGRQARVEAIGLRPGERAELYCVFEEGGWKVDLPLPALPPQDVRATGQEP